jgi:hypothetical protein
VLIGSGKLESPDLTKILTYEFSYFSVSCYYRSRMYAMPTKDVIPFPAGPLPCANIAATCPACGSLTLTAHRYCVGCEKMIVLADRVSTYLPLPIGAVGRVLRAA